MFPTLKWWAFENIDKDVDGPVEEVTSLPPGPRRDSLLEDSVDRFDSSLSGVPVDEQEPGGASTCDFGSPSSRPNSDIEDEPTSLEFRLSSPSRMG
jgi:hypothetical protein